jgi:hypothetical protein
MHRIAKQIIVPSVRVFGKWRFRGCKPPESVRLESVSRLERIEESALSGGGSKSIAIPPSFLSFIVPPLLALRWLNKRTKRHRMCRIAKQVVQDRVHRSVTVYPIHCQRSWTDRGDRSVDA